MSQRAGAKGCPLGRISIWNVSRRAIGNEELDETRENPSRVSAFLNERGVEKKNAERVCGDSPSDPRQ